MCCEQPAIGGILHWFIAVARTISDQVLEVIITLLLLVLGDIPCTNINIGKADKVWVVPRQGRGEVGVEGGVYCAKFYINGCSADPQGGPSLLSSKLQSTAVAVPSIVSCRGQATCLLSH